LELDTEKKAKTTTVHSQQEARGEKRSRRRLRMPALPTPGQQAASQGSMPISRMG
jgi:hypothetical protein